MRAMDRFDYENFDFGVGQPKPLSLDQAMDQASAMRRGDSQNFYRVERANGAGFVVKQVPVAEVYEAFRARVARSVGRYSLRRS